MKKCTQCYIEKELNEFHLCNKGKNGRKSKCKECVKIESKNYYKNNIEYYKNYYNDNFDKIREIKKNWVDSNNESVKLQQEKWRKNNVLHTKQYKKLNFEKLKSYNKNYGKIRRESDVLFKLSGNIRTRISQFIKSNKFTKRNKTFEIVGCSSEFLKKYLEEQFTDNMSWDNHGTYGWHIDHKIPLSSAKTEKEFYELCHYTNLQPLWAKDNLSKNNRLI